jgi:hypothetical protein
MREDDFPSRAWIRSLIVRSRSSLNGGALTGGGQRLGSLFKS